MLKRMASYGFRAFVASAGSGLLLAGSCSSAEVKQAVLAGVEVAANDLLNNAQEDDDISFGDWLSSELED